MKTTMESQACCMNAYGLDCLDLVGPNVAGLCALLKLVDGLGIVYVVMKCDGMLEVWHHRHMLENDLWFEIVMKGLM
ncbi:unnamed protein product [Lathyrus oleraceus]